MSYKDEIATRHALVVVVGIKNARSRTISTGASFAGIMGGSCSNRVTELACPGGQLRQKIPGNSKSWRGFCGFGLVIAWNTNKYLVFKFKRSQPVRCDP